MQGVAVFCRCQITAHLKQDWAVGCKWWRKEMKRVKSNQTAAYVVAATLASLPDFSTTGEQTSLSPPRALPSPSRSWSICLNVSVLTSPPHLLISTSRLLYLSSADLPFLLFCHVRKGACMLVEASGRELSIKTQLPHSQNGAMPLMAQKYLKVTQRIKKRLCRVHEF